jgi:hypothetical protein
VESVELGKMVFCQVAKKLLVDLFLTEDEEPKTKFRRCRKTVRSQSKFVTKKVNPNFFPKISERSSEIFFPSQKSVANSPRAM